MRRIFLTVLLLNVLLAVWQFAGSRGWVNEAAEVRSAIHYRPTPGVALVKLLGEPAEPAAGIEPVSPSPADATLLPATTEALSHNEEVPVQAPGDPAEGRQMCVMLGPYEKSTQADAAISRLAAADIPAKIKEIEVSIATNFLVYLPPLADRSAAKAKLDLLKAAGFDSYIIPSGELSNGIALGAFDSGPAAQKLYDLLQQKGLDAKIRDGQQLQQKEIWVAVIAGQEVKLGEELVQSLLGVSKSLEKRQILCSAIASP